MNIAKYSLWIIVLILFSSFVSALTIPNFQTTGSPTSVNGFVNNMYSYDGNDGFNTSSNGFPMGQSNWSIFNIYNNTAYSSDVDLLAWGSNSVPYGCVRNTLYNGNFLLAYCGASTSWSVTESQSIGSYYVMRKNGTTAGDVELIFNGVKQGLGSGAGIMNTSSSKGFSVGWNKELNGKYFDNGGIDTTAIFNVSLSDNQVAMLNKSTQCSQIYDAIGSEFIVGCWDMENTSAYVFHIPTTLTINKDYNVTSAYANQTIWRTDESGWVLSSDNTPTVTFTTNKNANCSIGLNNLDYYNMTQADSNTTCLTTDTTSHSCTLPSSQQLSEGYQNITLACYDGTDYNTTQPLNIHYRRINQVPSITSFTIPSELLTTQPLNVYATCEDEYNNNLNVSYYAYVDKVGGDEYSGTTAVANGTNTLITTIPASSYNHLDFVNVSINCTDGENTTTIESSGLLINMYPNVFSGTYDDKTVRNTIDTLSTTFQCSDQDNDVLIYYDNSTLFNISSTTGSISHNPTIDDVGVYNIKLTCGDGYANVSQTFVYTINNTAPNTTIVQTSSPTYSVYDDLLGYCTATDLENTIDYEYKWYLDNTENNTGNLTGYSSGTQVYIPNLSSSILENDQNWTLSCRAYDGLNYSDWVNSSVARIFNYTLDNCTSSTTKTLLFSIYNEDIPSTHLNASFEIDIQYWVLGSTFTKNYSALMNGEYNYSICINPAFKNIQANVYIKYATAFTHRYYLQNTTLTNQTTVYNIYNHNDTGGLSDLKITARDTDTYLYYPNVLGKLQRFYVSEGVWRTVQMDKSGDYGLLFYNIIEQNTDYRLLFVDSNNNILKTTDSLKFVCDSGVCSIDYLLNPYAASAAASSIVYVWNYSNGFINLTWDDQLTGTNTLNFYVIKDTLTGQNTICSATQTGSAGVFNCNLTAYSGQVFFIVEENGDNTISEWVDLSSTGLHTHLSTTQQSLWAFAILLTCVMFGLFSPVGVIIAAILGLIVVFALGIFNPLTITLVTIGAAMGLLLSFKIRT